MMKVFICETCGHIEFGEAPEKCPVCYMKKFTQNDKVFEESMAQSSEAAVKHIPQVTVEKTCGLVPENDCIDIITRIGETLHPMTEGHFISFIDCYLDLKYVSRIYLTPDMNPAVVFHLASKGKGITIVENCNKHGYWKTEVML